MSERDDGGPAFPQTDVFEHEVRLNQDPVPVPATSERGMSLRDYFAAAALSGLLANQKFDWDLAPAYTPDENVSRRALEIADAMLKARQ